MEAQPLSGTTGVKGAGFQGAGVDISQIIMELGLASMKIHEKKIESYYTMMQQNNRRMENLNTLMAHANTNSSKSIDTNSATELDFIDPETGTKSKMNAHDLAQRVGVSISANKTDNMNTTLTPAQWKTVVENIKTKSDSLASSAQMDQTKLQQALNKLNEVTQMISNNMNKFNQMAMAIIGNMR